jgi:hypothetical protein
MPKPVPPSKAKRATAADRKRQARIEARAKLVQSVHPARTIPQNLEWYAIMSRSGQEFAFAAAMETRAGAFCVVARGKDITPRRKRTVRRPQPVARPLFAGLIFAGFQVNPNWAQIEAIPAYYGRAESLYGVPARIPSMQVIAYRDAAEIERNGRDTIKGLSVGSRVRVMGIGREDQIKAIDGANAVLESMMMGVHVKAKLASLELMEAA